METQIQQIASLIGDPVRSVILWTLMDGRSYTATELASATNTSLPNISMHLAKLTNAGLLAAEKQGRHRYFRFSKDEVAYAMEAIVNLVADNERKRYVENDALPPIKYCRSCYDHLAGKVGVLLTEQLLREKVLRFEQDSDKSNFVLTKKGIQLFDTLNIDVKSLRQKRRLFAKACLDWSERRYHLAGVLGAALLERMLKDDWLRRIKNSRALVLTSKGRSELYNRFKLEI